MCNSLTENYKKVSRKILSVIHGLLSVKMVIEMPTTVNANQSIRMIMALSNLFLIDSTDH